MTHPRTIDHLRAARSLARAFATTLAATLGLLAGDARAEYPYPERSAGGEASAHGAFSLAFESKPDGDSACQLEFAANAGATKKLFRVPSCYGGEGFGSGTSQVGAVREVGETSLPLTAKDGTELHLFGIAVARGGNATDAFDYWAVLTTPKGSFVKALGTPELTRVKLGEGTTPKFVIEQEPTTRTHGVRHTVGFGSHRVETLPKLKRRVVAKTEATYVGVVAGGFHVNQWRVQFQCTGDACAGAPEELTNNGACSLPGAADDGWNARVRLRTTTWSDGDVEVLCLSSKRL